MQETNLTHENFIIQCAINYRNKQCENTEEFLSDLKRIKYIKKIFTRYSTNNVIDERLVLNHLIILNNVFGARFLCRMLFLKMTSQINILKPFLLYLNILPDFIHGVNGKNYDTVSFSMDPGVIERLRVIERNSKR